MTSTTPAFFYSKNGTSVYRIYRQAFSAAVGNITSGDPDRSFIRDAAGQFTTTLPTSGSYTYTGKVFNHIQSYVSPTTGLPVVADGNLTYTINFAGTPTGSGSISNVRGNRPSVGEFVISGTLNATPITVQTAGNYGVTGGGTNLTLAYTGTSVTVPLTGAVYDLGVFGPNADEVAGGIHSGVLESLVSGYGFAGVKTSP